MAFLSKIFERKSSIRKKCSRNDFLSLSLDDKKQLITDFLEYLKSRYSGKEFGYDSFSGLDYDQMVLSTIFSELKNAGHITGAGYMVFRLKYNHCTERS